MKAAELKRLKNLKKAELRERLLAIQKVRLILHMLEARLRGLAGLLQKVLRLYGSPTQPRTLSCHAWSTPFW